jgi:hypothetical protein
VLLVDNLDAVQNLQEIPRLACVTALRLQPRDAQSLVSNLATASCDMLFNLIKVPP